MTTRPPILAPDRALTRATATRLRWLADRIDDQLCATSQREALEALALVLETALGEWPPCVRCAGREAGR